MPSKKFYLPAALSLLLILAVGQSSKTPPSALEKAIADEQYGIADTLMKEAISGFLAQGRLDTLINFVSIAGEIANGLHGPQQGAEAALNMIGLLESRTQSPVILMNACRNGAEFFMNMGQYQNGYDISLRALDYARKIPEKDSAEIAQCEYNLGTYANNIGNMALSKLHHTASWEIRDRNRADAEGRYLSCNAMGSIYWYTTKYDSAAIFFEKALQAVSELPPNDMNLHYRPANILNNLAALQSAEGNTSQALQTTLSAIDHYRQFVNAEADHPKKKDARKAMYSTVDNLAAIYREIGDYTKAGDILLYSYDQKKQHLPAGHSDIFISEILLGQHYNDTRDYDLALDYLNQGLDKLEKSRGDYLFWQGDAYYAKALAYENKKDAAGAAACYEKAELLYDQSFMGEYDNIYMDFMRKAALFYASENNYAEAFLKSNKLLDYLKKVHEDKGLQGFYQLLNMAEVNFLTGRSAAAMQYSQDALAIVNEKIKDGKTPLDSVKINVYKPKAILLYSKAEYELQPKKDSQYLQQLADRLKEALQVVEKRKVLIDDPASINILIADNKDLIDFSKKIELELYRLTGHTSHLDRFINLHESGLYTRIRSRLDQQKAISFSHLPAEILQEENALKTAVSSSLQSDKPDTLLISDYLAALKNWEQHLDMVKKQYPAYYKMRYASIFKGLPELQSAIPQNSSLVRYFFTDNKLYALVADSTSKELIALDNTGLEDRIVRLTEYTGNEQEQLKLLHELFQMIWAPLAKSIHHKKVIIIPDGILFNLSFEMLTPSLLNSYSQLKTGSILTDHTLSYHYSLFMLDDNNYRPEGELSNNYIAFAPGFSDEIKARYKNQVKDSVNLDYTYLSLLPQPRTNELAKELKQLTGGEAFLDNASTQESFKKNAGGHKIVHVGTHGEFNNVNPGQSRLIFAKNTAAHRDSNSLFLSDIYRCDIQSDLTILTACESGKPGYQDGEGMISLAHAFNYAGSKAILTGLWKIDEQASSQITETFVRFLKDGLADDEALRKAKLEYLETARGRTLSPAYWAGMVLMGRPSAIDLESRSTGRMTWIWIIAGALLLSGAIWFIYRRKRTGAAGT